MSRLTAIKGALSELAWQRVNLTGTPSRAFAFTLDSIDAVIDLWSDFDGPDLVDHYRLGLIVGMLAYMVACRAEPDGDIAPMPVVYPRDNPVAVAASALRDAVLLCDGPTAA